MARKCRFWVSYPGYYAAAGVCAPTAAKAAKVRRVLHAWIGDKDPEVHYDEMERVAAFALRSRQTKAAEVLKAFRAKR